MTDPISILTWVVLGFIAGLIAKFLKPGRQGGGIIQTTILGILGAFLGAFIAEKTGLLTIVPGTFQKESIISAVVGALIILIAFGMIFGRKGK